MSEPNEECDRNSEDWREMTEKMTTDEKNLYMLEHNIGTDCTFVVGPEDGETKEFKVHRFLLCNTSPVFERMLMGEMMEAKTGQVRIIDFSPNTFQLLLSSIYGKNPELTTFEEAREFLKASHKYQMMVEFGVKRMCALISPKNIWTAFQIADLLQNEHLEEMCFQALQRDTLRCITDPGFMQASEENVALLLEQNQLNVDDEPSLVNVVVHWARHEARQRGLHDDDSGVRKVLKPCLLSLFRFLVMSPDQFMLGPGLAGWLNNDEKAAISECLRSKDVGKLKLLPHLCTLAEKRTKFVKQFNTLICKRKKIGSQSTVCKPKNDYYCPRYLTSQFNGYCDCIHATLIFRVKSSCQWLGFQYPSRCRTDTTVLSDEKLVYRENVIIFIFKFRHTISTDFSSNLISDMSWDRDVAYNSSISVMFDKPIPLVTDNWFALEVTFHQQPDDYKPLGHYLNPKRAQSVCTEAGVEFVFHTEEQSGYHNSHNEGLIKALIFSP